MFAATPAGSNIVRIRLCNVDVNQWSVDYYWCCGSCRATIGSAIASIHQLMSDEESILIWPRTFFVAATAQSSRLRTRQA